MSKKDILAWMREFKNFLFEFFLELCYPNTCVICGNLCNRGICHVCGKKYPLISEPRCKGCGKPISDEVEEYCQDCMQKKTMVTQGKNLWVHSGEIKNSIYRFKYKNHRIYGREYGRKLVKENEDFLRNWKPECIIPVPAHVHRKRSRGYNQAEVLAFGIKKEIKEYLNIDLPVYHHLIYRKIETKFQKQLNQNQRRKNLKGAFGYREKHRLPACVLVVDDIYTTGTTIQEVSKVCKILGAKEVVFMTISIGQGF